MSESANAITVMTWTTMRWCAGERLIILQLNPIYL